MHLKIHLINNTIFDGEARRITLNTPMGEISILDNHEPMITLVEYGNIYVETNEGEKLLKLMVDVGEGEEMLEDGSTPRLDSGQASSHLRPSEVLSSESRTGSRKTRQILSGIAKSYAPKD